VDVSMPSVLRTSFSLTRTYGTDAESSGPETTAA
jgi:hypothetical protein